MEEVAKCKTLIAIYKDEKYIMGGPHNIEFDTEDEKYHIIVEQCVTRKITIISKEEATVLELNKRLLQIEKLLMLFDGTFIPLLSLELLDSGAVGVEMLNSYKEHLIKNRLSYFCRLIFAV